MRHPARVSSGRRLAAALALTLAATGCGGDEPPPTVSSHERMVRLLDEIEARTNEENRFLGDAAGSRAEQQLEQLGPDADPVRRANLHYIAGLFDLRHGRIREGIAHYIQAAGALPPELQDGPAMTELLFEIGVAYLRLGETENCCARNTAESCILPIRAGGVHVRTEGSSKAGEYFIEVLKREEGAPNTDTMMAARWLLNLAAMTINRYPDRVPPEFRLDASVFESEVDFPRFENVSPKLRLDTFNLSGGAIVDDFDGDDYLDIVTSTCDTSGPTKYFRSNGDGTFTDLSEAAGLEGLRGGLNLVQADYDNDGDTDFFILRGAWYGKAGRHPNSLVRNDGGTFTDVTFDAGLGDVHAPTKTGAWADYDNDGDLDLFVGNESDAVVRAPCQLFRNDGGRFTDVAHVAGVADELFAMGAVWGDVDGDRWPDLFVSAGGDNRLYHNEGDGTFTDVAAEAGVAAPSASFSTWFWDFDNDGVLDLWVGASTGTVGLVSRFVQGLPLGGGSEGEMRFPKASTSARTKDGRFELSCLYRGDGTGRFADVTMAGGFGHLQKGHGISFADIDHDGDQDVYVQLGGAVPGDRYSDALFENPGFGNHWLTVKLTGRESNRSAIGARIRVDFTENGVSRSVWRWVTSGGSFGASPLRQTIGLGKAETIDVLEIYWPTTDLTQTLRNVQVDRTVEIVEGENEIRELPLSAFRLGGGDGAS